MNRKRLILFILLITFVLAATWSYTAVPRQKTVSRLKYTQGLRAEMALPAGKTGAIVAYDGRILNIALLEREHADFKGYRRNIFKPLFIDEQKLLRQKAAALKPPQLPPVQIQKAPVATQPEPTPLPRFTFLGFLKNDAQRTIFLARDKDIILVKKGDKVAGLFEATSITDQALTLRATDTGAEIVIPLIENRPLGATR